MDEKRNLVDHGRKATNRGQNLLGLHGAQVLQEQHGGVGVRRLVRASWMIMGMLALFRPDDP